MPPRRILAARQRAGHTEPVGAAADFAILVSPEATLGPAMVKSIPGREGLAQLMRPVEPAQFFTRETGGFQVVAQPFEPHRPEIRRA